MDMPHHLSLKDKLSAKGSVWVTETVNRVENRKVVGPDVMFDVLPVLAPNSTLLPPTCSNHYNESSGR